MKRSIVKACVVSVGLLGTGSMFGGCELETLFTGEFWGCLASHTGTAEACHDWDALVHLDRDNDTIDDDKDDCPDEAGFSPNGCPSTNPENPGSRAPRSKVTDFRIPLEGADGTVSARFTGAPISIKERTIDGPRLVGDELRVQGRVRLRGPAPGGISGGRWYSLIDYAIDTSTAKARFRGPMLLELRPEGTGSTCVRLKARFAVSDDDQRSIRGRFRSLGGTGDGARLGITGFYRASGPLHGHLESDGGGTIGDVKAHTLPASCEHVAEVFSLD